jgi:hypothetical protein
MKRLITLFPLLFSLLLQAQELRVEQCNITSYVSREDSVLVEQKVAMLKQAGGTVPELMLKAAKSMYGTPYVGGQLGLGDTPEKFRVVLGHTDCILFVEAMLCLSRTAASAPGKGPWYGWFAAEMAQCRYRNPRNIRYFSDRIHYTTEWIRNLESKGVVKDITLELGGEYYDHPINYMSTHPSAYKMGKADIDRIAAVEKGLNEESMTVIPPEVIPRIASKVRNGDIICYVTTIGGLDISHVAVACIDNGVLRFIHASSAEMKVVLDAKSVANYAAGRRNCAGIKVVRPL